MPLPLLLKHITRDTILEKLISMRCDCAEKYQKQFVVDSLSGDHKKSAINAENGLLYKIFPPRRKWVHISEGKRKIIKVVAGVAKTKKLTQKIRMS